MKKRLLSLLLAVATVVGMTSVSFAATDYSEDVTPPEMVVTDGDAYVKEVPPIPRNRAAGTYLWTMETSALNSGNLIASSITGKSISTSYKTVNIELAKAAGGVPTVGVCYVVDGYVTSVGKTTTTTLSASVKPSYKSGYTHYGFVKNEATIVLQPNKYDYYGA